MQVSMWIVSLLHYWQFLRQLLGFFWSHDLSLNILWQKHMRCELPNADIHPQSALEPRLGWQYDKHPRFLYRKHLVYSIELLYSKQI